MTGVSGGPLLFTSSAKLHQLHVKKMLLKSKIYHMSMRVVLFIYIF